MLNFFFLLFIYFFSVIYLSGENRKYFIREKEGDEKLYVLQEKIKVNRAK